MTVTVGGVVSGEGSLPVSLRLERKKGQHMHTRGEEGTSADNSQEMAEAPLFQQIKPWSNVFMAIGFLRQHSKSHLEEGYLPPRIPRVREALAVLHMVCLSLCALRDRSRRSRATYCAGIQSGGGDSTGHGANSCSCVWLVKLRAGSLEGPTS